MTLDAVSDTGASVSDATLIASVRSGDNQAYAELFNRHKDAATRLAQALVPGPDADDLVSEGFTKVLVTLQDGRGPNESFRAYLLTAIRRLHVDRMRSLSRVRPTEDQFVLDGRVDFIDTAEIGFERTTTAEAFKSLPERWQMVLWHLDVEGQRPADVAPLLGMSANSVSALAYRAREGLRQAYLQHHLTPSTDKGCSETISQLGAHVRGGLSRRSAAKVDSHLDTCRSCMGLFMELDDFNGSLAAILGPALLGSNGMCYLKACGVAAGAGAGASSATTSLSASANGVAGMASSFIAAVGPVGIASGVIGIAVVAGGALMLTANGPGPDKGDPVSDVAIQANSGSAGAAAGSSNGSGSTNSNGSETLPGPASPAIDPTDPVTPAPTDEPTADPNDDSREEPREDTSDKPGDDEKQSPRPQPGPEKDPRPGPKPTGPEAGPKPTDPKPTKPTTPTTPTDPEPTPPDENSGNQPGDTDPDGDGKDGDTDTPEPAKELPQTIFSRSSSGQTHRIALDLGERFKPGEPIKASVHIRLNKNLPDGQNLVQFIARLLRTPNYFWVRGESDDDWSCTRSFTPDFKGYVWTADCITTKHSAQPGILLVGSEPGHPEALISIEHDGAKLSNINMPRWN